MSPEFRLVLHAVIALLRTMPGVDEAAIREVDHFLNVVIRQAEKGEECPVIDSRPCVSWPLCS